MDNKLTYQDVLDETIEYYKTNPRGFNAEDNECVYLGPNNEMCAVGRCLINPGAFKNDYSAKSLIEDNSMNVFKEEYRHLDDLEFWHELQIFHDREFIEYDLLRLQKLIKNK